MKVANKLAIRTLMLPRGSREIADSCNETLLRISKTIMTSAFNGIKHSDLSREIVKKVFCGSGRIGLTQLQHATQ